MHVHFIFSFPIQDMLADLNEAIWVRVQVKNFLVRKNCFDLCKIPC
jgi:hypothetical protein